MDCTVISVFIVGLSLFTLMLVAYRGNSVILFAPLIAMGSVLLTDPSLVAPVFTGLFMEKMVSFLKLYFPLFLLGAVFGKLIELSGFSQSIVAWVIGRVGAGRAIIAIVSVSALLTYGGVSLFVVVFAVYPFAAELFQKADIPKRLIPGTIALGAFTFTMDALPGTPQIQNLIPTNTFHTTAYAAPWLGIIGSVFILLLGLVYLEWRKRVAKRAGEGYGKELRNEPEQTEFEKLPHVAIAILPLVAMAVCNKMLTLGIPKWYSPLHSFSPTAFGKSAVIEQEIAKVSAIWAVEGALLLAIAVTFMLAWRSVVARFAESSKTAIAGSLLAAMNTASEYGFGAVIASLPGFVIVARWLQSIPDPLIQESVAITSLAGLTGSASGGLSIALSAMGDTILSNAELAGIPMEVVHRVASMASGGMDTLPHNGAVITLLAVTGLTHRQSYIDIFAITLIKTAAVFFVILVYRMTGIV